LWVISIGFKQRESVVDHPPANLMYRLSVKFCQSIVYIMTFLIPFVGKK